MDAENLKSGYCVHDYRWNASVVIRLRLFAVQEYAFLWNWNVQRSLTVASENLIFRCKAANLYHLITRHCRSLRAILFFLQSVCAAKYRRFFLKTYVLSVKLRKTWVVLKICLWMSDRVVWWKFTTLIYKYCICAQCVSSTSNKILWKRL